MKPTPQKPSKELIKAAETVFLAMAYQETIRPEIEAIHKKLIDFWKFEPAKHWRDRGMNDLPEVITDPKHAYLMDEQDSKIYFDEMDEEYKKAGYEVKPRYCPLLIAEDLTRQAQRVLIEEAYYITGLSLEQATRSLTTYKKLVDLLLKLCAPFVNAKETMKQFA